MDNVDRIKNLKGQGRKKSKNSLGFNLEGKKWRTKMDSFFVRKKENAREICRSDEFENRSLRI